MADNKSDLADLWKRISTSNSGSLLKKHLSPPVYEKLKDKVTNFGGTLADCIRSGCLHLKSHCGIYASDPDAYDTFSDVFYPILKEYHKVDKLEHPKPDFGDLNNLGFGDLDPKNEFINSTRIRVGRSHQGYGFPPTSSKEDRLEMERITVEALRTLRGDLAGKYFPLQGMSAAEEKQMVQDHFLFRNDDPVLGDANGYDDWPAGRGIFFSHNKRFLVWVNEEDHLRIISMQPGGNLAEVWQRLVKGLTTLDKKLTFAHHPKFGYLTFCPTNLGTTLRASVHMRIPNLSKHKVDKLEHPKPDFGDLNNLGFGDLDPKNEFINSTRIRVGRSHAGYGFPPTSSKQDRLEMERITVDALRTLRGDLAGKYFPLQGMTAAEEKQLVQDHFLFRNDDPVLGDANGYDDWPAGRGIFFSHNKRFLVWVNEEDHLRIISMQPGGNLAEVWQRLVKGLTTLEKKLTFAHHPKFGYLTFCPTNLGTTLRASVHIRIPNLSKHKDFKEICEKLNLQPRGIHGEHSDSEGGVYDISNKRRMGLTEIEAVQEMRRGVERIIELEKGLKTQK